MDGGEGGTDGCEDAINSLVQRAVDGAAGGELVAASAEVLSDGSYVDGAFGTEADADAALGQLAEEGSGLDTGDTKGIVYDAFAVVVGGRGADHVVVGNGEPAEAAFALEIGESCAEEKHLGNRRGKTNILSDADGIGPGEDQVAREGECGGAEGAVVEAARVGKEGRVEAGGHLGSNDGAGCLDKTMHEFANANGLMVNPVEIGPVGAGDVVIDVDKEVLVEAAKAGAPDAIALE
jgi:hypothetical protein